MENINLSSYQSEKKTKEEILSSVDEKKLPKQFTILFIWSKGCQTRKKILKIIGKEHSKNNPVFASEIAKIYNENERIQVNGKEITISAIRKHIKILLHYSMIIPINTGGRPEYLRLTQDGVRIYNFFNAQKNSVSE